MYPNNNNNYPNPPPNIGFNDNITNNQPPPSYNSLPQQQNINYPPNHQQQAGAGAGALPTSYQQFAPNSNIPMQPNIVINMPRKKTLDEKIADWDREFSTGYKTPRPQPTQIIINSNPGNRPPSYPPNHQFAPNSNNNIPMQPNVTIQYESAEDYYRRKNRDDCNQM